MWDEITLDYLIREFSYMLDNISINEESNYIDDYYNAIGYQDYQNINSLEKYIAGINLQFNFNGSLLSNS